jgi:lysophospholipase L1-like esterase
MSGEFYDPNDQPKIGRPRLSPGRPFPAAAIYAMSQKICEKIRAVSLAYGIAFIDTRPAFRKAAAGSPLQGPRDWGHPNEAGYRLLGNLLAARINEPAQDACDDHWEP